MIILVLALPYILIALAVTRTVYATDPDQQLASTQHKAKAALLGIGWPIVLLIGVIIVLLLAAFKITLEIADLITGRAKPYDRRL